MAARSADRLAAELRTQRMTACSRTVGRRASSGPLTTSAAKRGQEAPLATPCIGPGAMSFSETEQDNPAPATHQRLNPAPLHTRTRSRTYVVTHSAGHLHPPPRQTCRFQVQYWRSSLLCAPRPQVQVQGSRFKVQGPSSTVYRPSTDTHALSLSLSRPQPRAHSHTHPCHGPSSIGLPATPPRTTATLHPPPSTHNPLIRRVHGRPLPP